MDLNFKWRMEISLFPALTILFVVLKLVGVITWSWWIVLMPTLAEIAIGLSLVAIIICHNAWHKYR